MKHKRMKVRANNLFAWWDFEHRGKKMYVMIEASIGSNLTIELTPLAAKKFANQLLGAVQQAPLKENK